MIYRILASGELSRFKDPHLIELIKKKERYSIIGAGIGAAAGLAAYALLAQEIPASVIIIVPAAALIGKKIGELLPDLK